MFQIFIFLVIIGILASIAIPAFSEYKQKAYDTQAISQVMQARTAFQASDVQGNFSFYPNGELSSISGGTLAEVAPGFVHQTGVDIQASNFSLDLIRIFAGHCKGTPIDDNGADLTATWHSNTSGGVTGSTVLLFRNHGACDGADD